MRHITTLIFALSLAAATASSSLASGRPAPHFESGGTFSGSFVINSITDPLNGSADTNAFNMLMGHSLRFVIVFDAVTSEVFAEDADGNLRWDLMTAPPQVYFFGDETDYLRGIVGQLTVEGECEGFDYRISSWDSLGDHLRTARSSDSRMVDRISLLAIILDLPERRRSRSAVHDSTKASIGDHLGSPVSGRRRCGRSLKSWLGNPR